MAAVPERLDRDTKLAENGGPCGIEMLADMLLDYAAARTVEIDPRVETRETWLALTSAASLYRDYARAQTVPAGGEVRAFVDYLGVGFGFLQERDESLSAHDWVWAYQVALAIGKDDVLLGLYPLVQSLPEDDDPRPSRLLGETAPRDLPGLPRGPDAARDRRRRRRRVQRRHGRGAGAAPRAGREVPARPDRLGAAGHGRLAGDPAAD